MNDLIRELEKILPTLPPPGTPEYEAVLPRLVEALGKNGLSQVRKIELADQVRKLGYCAEGYAAFFELMHGAPPPKHVMEGEIIPILKSLNGTLVFAWRGSWKTTSISITFLLWFIGLFPEKSNLVVCASGNKADDLVHKVTSLIELSPNFKLAFPTIVKGERWSENGYEVLDSSKSREEWADLRASSIDPTLFAAGYDSHLINGRHPTGLLICDDLHDEKNTASETLLQGVINQLVNVILKTPVVRNDEIVTKAIFIGTPWKEHDAYYYLKDTGEYDFVNIPAAVRASEGDEGALYCDGVSTGGAKFEDIVGWWKFTHTEEYRTKQFISDRAKLRMKIFWLQIMLNVVASSSGDYVTYSYPYKEIDNRWRGAAGLDPTNSDESSERKGSKMAIGVVLRLPSGGGVVAGGTLKYASLQQTEDELFMVQGKYPNLQPTAVENVGGGKVVLQALQKNPRIRVMPSGLKDVSDGRVSNKRDRMEIMHKWFENGTVRISDEDTPFLNAFRRLWDRFRDLDPKHSEEFDAGDAVWHALNNMPDILQVPYQDSFPVPVKEKQESPLKGFQNFRGY